MELTDYCNSGNVAVLKVSVCLYTCRLDTILVTSFHIIGGTTCSTRQQATLTSLMLRFGSCFYEALLKLRCNKNKNINVAVIPANLGDDSLGFCTVFLHQPFNNQSHQALFMTHGLNLCNLYHRWYVK